MPSFHILDNNEKAQISDLYYKYENILLRYAMSILKNQAMAEDALHNAFVSIIEHKDDLHKLSDRDILKWCVII